MSCLFPGVDLKPKLSLSALEQAVHSTLYRRYGKRVLDVGIAAIGLVLSSPIMAVVALLVKLTSPGPVFYRQHRVGRDGKMFRILKFRSMEDGADRHGPAITASGDPRITRFGEFLRNSKLDELPQLWNVFLGEMSLVGPRPEVPRYVASYTPAQRRVLTVRPGITDPASIIYRREEDLLSGRSDPDGYYREVILPHKISLYLSYIDHLSFQSDARLILQTAFVVLNPQKGPA